MSMDREEKVGILLAWLACMALMAPILLEQSGSTNSKIQLSSSSHVDKRRKGVARITKYN